MNRWIVAAGAVFGLLSCSENVPGVGCQGDADCFGAGVRCLQQVCVSEPEHCARGEECFPGRICFEQRCAEDTRPERCSPACETFDECVAGVCARGFERIEVLAPSPGPVGPMAEVRALLVRRTDGIAVAPDTLVLVVEEDGAEPFEVPLTRGDGLQYSTLVEFPRGGSYRLRARMLELESEALPLEVDKTGPALLTYVANPNRALHEKDPELEAAYRRDERVTVFVMGPDDVDPASVTLKVSGTAGELSVPLEPAGTSCPTNAQYCSVGHVDLWKPPLEMKAARASFGMRVNGADRFGNRAAEHSAAIPVTRFKWAIDLQGGAIKTSPAIGSNGDVYVGTANTPGKAVAISPDGTVKWSFTTGGPVLASVLIGEVYGKETVFVAGKAVGGNTGAIWAIDKDSILNGFAPLVSAWSEGITAGMALSQLQYPTLWVLSGSAGLLLTGVEFRDAGPRLASWVDDSSQLPLAGAAASNGTNVFFRDSRGRVHSVAMANGNLSSRDNFPILVGGSVYGAPVALTATSLVGGTTADSIFSIAHDGSEQSSTNAGTWSWSPSVAHDGAIFIGSEDKKLLRVAPSGELSYLALDGVAFATPALSQDGTIYLASRSKKTVAVAQGGEAMIWSIELSDSSDSSPALDCSRDLSGAAIPGRPGVLYVGSDDGRLYSIVTDSRGIDTQSPWPKFQHDPRNTGNADTDLAQFACP